MKHLLKQLPTIRKMPDTLYTLRKKVFKIQKRKQMHTENWSKTKQLIKDNFDVLSSFRLRTITMGVNLIDCIDNDLNTMINNIDKQRSFPGEIGIFNEVINSVIQDMSGLFNVTLQDFLQTRRIAVTPLETMSRSMITASKGSASEINGMIVSLAQYIENTVKNNLGYPKLGQNVFLGGAGILADWGISKEREPYLNALPDVLANTQIFNVDLTVGSTKSGIYFESIRQASDIIWAVGENDIKNTRKLVPDPCNLKTWDLTLEQMTTYRNHLKTIQSANKNAVAYPFFSNLARLSVFVNPPEENPYMAGGYAGLSTPMRTISIGISGAEVIEKAILKAESNSINDILQSVKHYAGIMYSISEAIRFEIIARMNEKGMNIGEAHGSVDLSIAATNERDTDGNPINSIASALSQLGVKMGSHGSVGAVGLIIDTLKKAGAAKVTYVGGLSGAFIPISEDAGMGDAIANGWLSYPKYLSMSSVCSVGTDMFAAYWPQNISQSAFKAHIGGMLLDQMSIGIYANKTTSCRILPVPYEPKSNFWVIFLGSKLFGSAPVLDMQFSTLPPPTDFVNRDGSIPAPLTSFRN